MPCHIMPKNPKHNAKAALQSLFNSNHRHLPVGVRRAASATLLALTVKNRKNQADLLAYDALCNEMFNNFLATCGDYNTQVSGAESNAFGCFLLGCFHFVYINALFLSHDSLDLFGCC